MILKRTVGFEYAEVKFILWQNTEKQKRGEISGVFFGGETSEISIGPSI